jgi:DNA ligase 1
LGAVAGEVLEARTGQGLGLLDVSEAFRGIAAARGPAAKTGLVRDLLARATPLEAKYIVKIVTGDLRIGLKESMVEEAIAKAYGGTLAGLLKQVQRANMLLGDIGETLRMALEGKLAEAKMRMFHPLGFMLASPIESAEEGLSYFAEAAVEDKYDGIRAQAHLSEGEVKFFSRTRDEITESFPELPNALAGLPQDAILDGEIVAWEYPQNLVRRRKWWTNSSRSGVQGGKLGRARPFSVLQQRLGKRKLAKNVAGDSVAYLVFDVLYAGGELLIDRPLRERARILDELLAAERKIIHHRVTESQRKTKQRKLTSETRDPRRSAHSIIRAPVFRAASQTNLKNFLPLRRRGATKD